MFFGIARSLGDTSCTEILLNSINNLLRECTVLPCLKSPIIAMRSPSIFRPKPFNSFSIVYKSSNAWLGCSLLPSPPFMTGTRLLFAKSATESGSGCRIQIISLKPDNTLAVSCKDSPFAKAEDSNPTVSLTSPPKRLKALPKLIRVLVLASKNMLPRIAPSRTRVLFCL